MRKIRLLLLTTLFTLVLSITVNAQEDQIKSKDIKVGNSIIRAMTVSSQDDPLAYTSDFITDSGSYLSISSSTGSTITCDSLKLEINVQEKKNGSWETVGTFTYTEYNTSIISKIPCYYGVTIGSEYRLKTYHYATVGGINYMEINTTSSIITEE
ncbi:hypothetical protein [Vallitalea sp.]|jgi:hypothetical protein|uniref:hypothetical protein n=1 Tax=Vallitalea sp. TaxID=1882829 RepID=UPI0025E3E663|nr:hypothetical protein [Vallitalea sp.]MCT4685722.1 hypothetical protein [Vallitalea sp.]